MKISSMCMAMENIFLYTETCTNPQRAREIFCEMREMGTDSVIICVYEQDLLRWKKDMPRLFDLAGEAGLRRYISYGRYGGAFSGGLMVPSLFTFLHPETLVVPLNSGQTTVGEADVVASEFFRRTSCVNHPAFRKYMVDQTREIFSKLKPDGILFDEPKGLQLPCACKYCTTAQKKDETCEEANLRFQVEFVRDLAEEVKAHSRDLHTMLVVGHHDEIVLAKFAEIEALDVLGVEAYWISRGKDMAWMREWCPAMMKKLALMGKKTQLWANNWGVPKQEEDNLVEAYRIMATSKPDQLASFWWWRGSDDPERVMELTRKAMLEFRRDALRPLNK